MYLDNTSQVSSLPMMDSAISTRLMPLGLYNCSKQLTTMVFKYHETDDIFSRAGYYTMGEELDYPSVSHISSVAQVHLIQFIQHESTCQTGLSLTSSKDGNFNIVFAIKKDYESAYKALARWV